jgi:hypothetical protein
MDTPPALTRMVTLVHGTQMGTAPANRASVVRDMLFTVCAIYSLILRTTDNGETITQANSSQATGQYTRCPSYAKGQPLVIDNASKTNTQLWWTDGSDGTLDCVYPLSGSTTNQYLQCYYSIVQGTFVQAFITSSKSETDPTTAQAEADGCSAMSIQGASMAEWIEFSPS